MKRNILIIIFTVAVIIQFIPVERTNPAQHADTQIPEPVNQVLQRSCYDCHSNKTVWPFYSYVAPV